MSKTNNIQTIAERWIDSKSEKDFKELYNRLKPGLTNHLKTIINDYDQRQNIVSDVFINAITKIDSYKKEYAFSTWIYRIATNMAIRNKSRNSKYIYFDTVADSNMDPLEYFANAQSDQVDSAFDIETYEDIHSEMYEAVESVIRNMKPLYRDIMVDVKLNLDAYQVVANRYDLPLQTIKNRVGHGSRILKETLENEFPDLVKRYINFESV